MRDVRSKGYYEQMKGRGVRSLDSDAVLSLANRLVSLAKQLDPKALGRIENAGGGIPVAALGKGLIAALDPDAIVQAALATAQAKGITRSEDTLLPAEIEAARPPFDLPTLRDEIENARRTTAFTPEQTEWLRKMKDHIASSCCITRDDFDYAEFANKGGLQKEWGAVREGAG